MITKKYIKELEFNTIKDIFNYIVDSEINGNYSQVKEFMLKLSNTQFINFCKWFNYDMPQNTKPLNWFIEKRKE